MNAQPIIPQITFRERAECALKHGIPIVPVEPNDKKTLIGALAATTDPATIAGWNSASPEYNTGLVAQAKPGGVWILDCDSPEVAQQFKKYTGMTFPRTLTVQSSKAGHRYWKQNEASLKRLKNFKVTKDGKEFFSVRWDNQYCVGPLSNHPDGSIYRTIVDCEPVEAPDYVINWLLQQQAHCSTNAADDGGPIPEGARNSTLASIAGGLRHKGLNDEELLVVLQRINRERCTPSLDESDVRTIAASIARYPVEPAVTVYVDGKPAGSNPVSTAPDVPAVNVPLTSDEDDEEKIPDFDPSLINGIYKKIVDLVTAGTTLAPQFAFTVAKTLVGARMAGKVKFENLDVEARYYTALIGETGSGKGEAFRRMMKVFQPDGCISPDSVSQFTSVDSADSGAGLKDAFFDSKYPVVCYVDEVASLGNKSKDTRNPGILDTMGELADRTVISRVLAKRNGGSRTKNDARLSMVMCGQNGSVYTSAFAGRTQIGWWDRLYPEYGVPVEAGKLPPVDAQKAYQLLEELNALNVRQTIKMGVLAETYLDECWDSQPVEVRKKVRWKKHLWLDAFMSAFGRGSEMVDIEDAEVAIKIFLRQIVIRRVCFTTEVPDRVGFYLAQIKKVTARMVRQIVAGAVPEAVSRSRRDYETLTNAFRNNEEHYFVKAWDIHSKVHLQKVKVTRANGQTYERYIPAPMFE